MFEIQYGNGNTIRQWQYDTAMAIRYGNRNGSESVVLGLLSEVRRVLRRARAES